MSEIPIGHFSKDFDKITMINTTLCAVWPGGPSVSYVLSSVGPPGPTQSQRILPINTKMVFCMFCKTNF